MRESNKWAHTLEPAVMPVDRVQWAKELHRSNFVNTSTQYQDLQGIPEIGSVLIIGPGQGLDAAVLRWRGYAVTTVDIDETFRPDHVASVHDLGLFTDGQFDAAIASHVLEHLPERLLDAALKELARVAHHVLIYLPIAGRHCQLRMSVGRFELSLVVDAYNFFERPDGVSRRYCSGQHFWEIGYRGYRRADLKRRLRDFYSIIRVYRNRDWPSSLNFVLTSKLAPSALRVP